MAFADLVDDAARQPFAIGFHAGGRREELSLAALWADARRAAAGVRRQATPVGDDLRLGVLLTNDRPSVVLLMAAAASGVTLCSLPTPGRRMPADAYLEELGLVCAQAGVARVVADADLVPMLAVPGAEVSSTQELLERAGQAERTPTRAPAGDPDGFGIIQHTAATTGPPKGVRVADRQVCDHTALILQRIQPDRGWHVCSWLPLSHDMGLIGMLLTSIAYGGARWGRGGGLELLRPEDFVRQPWTWLRTCSDFGASVTAAPNFAYGLARRHLRRLDGIDLSRLVYVIVGGELVRPGTLSSFEADFAPAGFSGSALAPSYGMAEACLAISMPERGQGWTVHELAATEVFGARADASPLRLVSSGAPLSGVTVGTMEGSDGVQQLVVGGPQVVTEYLDGRRAVTPGGLLMTGDVGTTVDGRVYVAGRCDDVLVVRGRNLSAGRVEEEVATAIGRPPHAVAAVTTAAGGLALAIEIPDGVSSGARRALLDEAQRCVVAVAGTRAQPLRCLAPGELPRTSVGKLQRRRLADLLSGGAG